jgi:hypothetical protein
VTRFGRIFAQRVIVYFGQFYENYRSSVHWQCIDIDHWVNCIWLHLGHFFHKLILSTWQQVPKFSSVFLWGGISIYCKL